MGLCRRSCPYRFQGGIPHGEVLAGICMRHVSMGEVTEMWFRMDSSMTVGDIGAGRTNK